MATLSIDRTSRITITACLYVRRMRVGSTAVPIHEKHSTTSVQVRVRTVVAIDLSVCLCPVLYSPLLYYMHAARWSRQRRVCIARMWDRSRGGTMTMAAPTRLQQHLVAFHRGREARRTGARVGRARALGASPCRRARPGQRRGRPRVPLRLYATRHRLIPPARPASPISIPHACGCERRMLPQACTDRSTYRCMDGVVSIDQAIAS